MYNIVKSLDGLSNHMYSHPFNSSIDLNYPSQILPKRIENENKEEMREKKICICFQFPNVLLGKEGNTN